MIENVPTEIQDLIVTYAELEKLTEFVFSNESMDLKALCLECLIKITQSYGGSGKINSTNQKNLQKIEKVLLTIISGDYPVKMKTIAVSGINISESLLWAYVKKQHCKIKLATIDRISDIKILERIIKTDKSNIVRESAICKCKELKIVRESVLSKHEESKIIKESVISKYEDPKIIKEPTTYKHKESKKVTKKERLAPELFPIPEGKRLVFIDTETTGLTANDRVCQVSALVFDGQDLTPYSDYCNPHCKINPFAYRVHHIPQKLVDAAPDLCDTQTYKIIMQHNTAGNIFVFHNAPFDLRMLSYNGFNLKAPVIDTLSIARKHKCFPSNSLSTIVDYLNLNENGMKSHDALGDATMTFYLFNWLGCKYPDYMKCLTKEFFDI